MRVHNNAKRIAIACSHRLVFAHDWPMLSSHALRLPWTVAPTHLGHPADPPCAMSSHHLPINYEVHANALRYFSSRRTLKCPAIHLDALSQRRVPMAHPPPQPLRVQKNRLFSVILFVYYAILKSGLWVTKIYTYNTEKLLFNNFFSSILNIL